ncbi:MAG: ribosomal L7Ae/L30e/S12e/Gadd45 family protein [Gemmatimonadetes bacterium]|nr:ribosomal L7Ae/L30e/S12e/Gadd45 family protein [Gemmatimonadota bacterium]MCC6772059.1 ribosomal L7Ae/L30e/S12e/Gadd45 family protein [Gemmatimonadaceae bacterium]
MPTAIAADAGMNAVTERRLLGLLGLGVRGRGAVVGVERVRDAAKRGTLVVAVVAPDASRHSIDKVVPLLEARRVPIMVGPSAMALGHAVGKESTAVVGVVDRSLAAGVLALRGASSEGDTGPARAR